MKAKNPVLAIFLTVFIDMLGVGVMIPVFAPLIIKNEIGIIPTHFTDAERNIIYGFLTATFSFFQFFGAPILGTLADQHGRKKVLTFSIWGTIIGYILFAVAIYTKNLPLVFLARAIPGFTGGNISIAMAALADVSTPESKTKNFGLIGMSFGLGFILGPAIGGFLGKYDYSLPLWFTAFLSFINWILVRYQFPETFSPKEVKGLDVFAGIKNVVRAFELKNLRMLLLVSFLMAFGFTFFTQFFSVFMMKKFNASTQDIAIIFTYIGVWIAFTQGVITRVVSKKFSSKQVLLFSLLGMSVSMMLLLLPDAYYMIFVLHPLLAMSQGLTFPNLTTEISNLGTTENQGEILGVQASIQSIAFTIPPIIAGFISAINYQLPIIVGSAVILISWIIFSIFLKQKKQTT